MKKLILSCICSTICAITVAQKAPSTQAELDAFLKNVQKQSDSIQRVLKNKGINTPQGGTTKPGTTVPNKGIVNKNLPVKDSAKIRSIPKKNFNLSELNTYIVDLHSQLAKKFPDAVGSANAIAGKLGNVPAKLEAAAMIASQKGAWEEAVLLITDGASRATDDGLLLTNTGAILDMNGMSEKAVPILRTVVNYDPGNAIALNNLGQAYVQLGLADSAMRYLTRCINLSPQHPEANNTAGIIELKRGNDAKAKTYFENSIRGGFTLAAYRGVRTIDKDYRIAKLIRPKVKVTEYFNQFKYQLPRQCRNVNEAEELKVAHKVYREFLNQLKDKFKRLRTDAAKDYNAKTMERMQKMATNYENLKPFQALGAVMYAEISQDYTKEIVEIDKYNKENRLQYKQLENEYRIEFEKLMKPYNDRAESDCCGEGDVSCCPQSEEVCRVLNGLKNKYLVKFADLNDEWQARNLGLFKKYFDDLTYWNFLGSMDENEFRIRFFDLVDLYFFSASRVCETKILEPCRPDEPDDKGKPEESELKEFDCPVEIEIPFVVGKLEMSCEKFSFAAGEGIQFKYEKKFTGQRQSTMSIGVGLEIYKLKGAIAGVEAGVEVKAGMSVFLVFDKGNHLTDGGVQYGAKAAAGIGFEAGEKVKIKKDIMSVEKKAGWRFGYSSGISFD